MDEFKIMWGTRMGGREEADFHAMQRAEGYDLVCQVYVTGGPDDAEVGPEAREHTTIPLASMVVKNIYRKAV